MSNSKITIGIYGIQDSNNSETPTISHDHGVAIMKNGEVLASLTLERLDRKKHSEQLPKKLYHLLKSKKLFKENCNYVFVDNILGRSFINEQGDIRFEGPINSDLQAKTETGNFWFLDSPTQGYILNHELAHLGSCLPFFGNFKENSLLIHFDGGASKSNFSAWIYKNKKLSCIEYNWDLKWLSGLYNANALVFGMVNAKQFDLNSVPGKFMGFASFGEYSVEIENWLVKNNFFKDCWKSKSEFYDSAFKNFNIKLSSLDQKNPFIQNVAATIQQIFITTFLGKIKQLKGFYKTDYLYYSGGSALNILLNSKIVSDLNFKDVFIPPCCNDAGLALGAAAFFEWQNRGDIKIQEPYLNNWDIENYSCEYNEEIIEKTAELLLKNKVIGVCNNFGEIGPRALGNRSIISLANNKKLANKVSIQHKNREWYRPVAPIMLEKNTKYFTGVENIHHLSKYMLLEFDISLDKKQELEGCTHIDGTARIQTIFKREDNPFMFDLLSYLDEKHQIRALINTSFNYRGEPIVHTVDDALYSAKTMKLDAVILNGTLKTI